jgi:hypothetical protein
MNFFLKNVGLKKLIKLIVNNCHHSLTIRTPSLFFIIWPPNVKKRGGVFVCVLFILFFLLILSFFHIIYIPFK